MCARDTENFSNVEGRRCKDLILTAPIAFPEPSRSSHRATPVTRKINFVSGGRPGNFINSRVAGVGQASRLLGDRWCRRRRLRAGRRAGRRQQDGRHGSKLEVTPRGVFCFYFFSCFYAFLFSPRCCIHGRRTARPTLTARSLFRSH